MDNNLDNRYNKGKRQKIFIALAMVLVAVIFFLGGFFLNSLINGKKLNRVMNVLRIMENVGYVMDENGEPREITEEELADALVNGVLDEYSQYFTAKEYAEFIEKGKGNLKGIGIVINVTDLRVNRVLGNSPAERAGIMVDDLLISGEYNEEVVDFLDVDVFKEFISSVPDDTDFVINVKRNEQNLSFTVKKSAYTASYVSYYDSEVKIGFETDENGKMTAKTYNGSGKTFLPTDTAYVILSSFEGNADGQLVKALDFMKERGRTKLILDLRGNGGGFMNVLCEIAGSLIYCNGKNNFTVAVAESKNSKEKFYSGKNRFNTSIQSIAVLADQNSASASECLIGAMIHYGGAFNRDKLIIEKNANGKATTFGKGIMQSTYGLIGGGALKLTTARILWPDEETCIHGKGIETKAENQVERQNVFNRALEVL